MNVQEYFQMIAKHSKKRKVIRTYSTEGCKAYQDDKDIWHITLPLPLTLNSKFKNRNFNLSAEYKNYKENVVPLIVRGKGKIIKKISGNRNVTFTYLYYYAEDNLRDIDSMDKVLQDSLAGYVYEDDRQIWRIVKKEMRIDKNFPRVELGVMEEIR